MPTMRKTLGDPTTPCATELLQVMTSEKKEAVCRWCISFARERLLPIFLRHSPQDDRVEKTLDFAVGYLDGRVTFSKVKDAILKDAHQAARELEGHPSAQAAARACAHAASSVHALRHAMGLYYYGAAATAYDMLGTEQTPEVYALAAENWCKDLLAALKKQLAIKENKHGNI